MRLKNKITRQESRRPRPNTIGPRVPVENLAEVRGAKDRRWNTREDVEVHGEPNKEYFIKLFVLAILVGDGYGACGEVREGGEGVRMTDPAPLRPSGSPLGGRGGLNRESQCGICSPSRHRRTVGGRTWLEGTTMLEGATV